MWPTGESRLMLPSGASRKLLLSISQIENSLPLVAWV